MSESCTREAIQIDSTVFDSYITEKTPSFIERLEERSGTRPDTLKCLPHSQLSQNPSKDIWTTLKKKFFELPDIDRKPSLVSVPGAEAAFLKEGVEGTNFIVGREFAHVHPVEDGSLHILLSPKDAKLVVEKQWGELHLLAGKNMSNNRSLPIGLVMIYAPRTEAEIDTVMNIVKASLQYAKCQQS